MAKEIEKAACDFFTDVKTAVKVVKDLREARKSGAVGVEVRPVRALPVLRGGGWYDTMEGCTLSWQPREVSTAVRRLYNALDDETKHALTFTPKHHGDWVERAKWWQAFLKPSLPKDVYYAAISAIIGWYIICVKRGLGTEVAA